MSEKVRIRFRKAGDLRLVSHHDLMQVFERMLRRAQIPFRSTQGFHPKPRMVFALSLALGVVGCEEVVEIELCKSLTAAEFHQRLYLHSPPGLGILSVRSIDRRIKARVCRVCYSLPVPSNRQADLTVAVKDLVDSSHCWVERVRPKPRRFDLRAFLHEVRLHEGQLHMSLWVGQGGMARPDEVLQALGLRDLLDDGAVLSRTRLQLADEMAESDLCEQWQDPTGRKPFETKPMDKDKPARPKALVPGPMSFDS